MLLQFAILFVAIVLLYFGAEFALESAEKIGLALGFSPLVIGLLIVGFGTSLPEFFVSQLACYRGESEIALGNVVGSNIANLFLILGVSGVISSLYITAREIKIQFYFHIAITLLLSYFLLQPKITWSAAAAFGAFFGFYLFDTFRQMKRDRGEMGDLENPRESHKIHLKDYGLLILGFVFLYFGGELLVSSGTKIALSIGISSYVVSAVFVAFGTSFPELVTAIMTAKKGKNTDIIVGNIIGSNIFNVAFVLGSVSFYNIDISSKFYTEIAVLIFAALFLPFMALIKRKFGTYSGILFLCIYGGIVFSWVKNN